MRTKATYYSITPEAGFTDHNSAQIAKDSAEEELEDGSDGWHEETPATQWGLLLPLQHAAEHNRREPTEMDPDFDYLCEYQLAPTPIVNIMEAVPEEHRARVALAVIADIAAWAHDSPGDRVGDAADHLLALLKQRYPETA